MARYYERAADHLAALASEGVEKPLFRLLADAIAGLERARGSVEDILDYLKSLGRLRHIALEMAQREREAIHVVRVLDYLENSAEVYIDMALYLVRQYGGSDKH
ncbi:hypothetical protein [Pyrobaculum islandicum]|uniref:hypothetical protein n=1 Tax=Pyrobaculum islandicum TaxID=2277 RepID=UPI00069D66FF|nr:hypothetical protein [Pyrobaculum islandicum]